MLVAFMMAINLFFISNNDTNNSNEFTSDLEEVYFETSENDIINFTSNEE